MNKKLVAGAIIVIAAGLTTFLYKKRKNKLQTIAANTYDDVDNAFHNITDKAENLYQ